MNAISLVHSALSSRFNLALLVGDRIYLNELDQQQALPQIVLSDISDTPINDLTGEASTFNERIQIDVHANQYSEAKQISDEIRTVLSGQSTFQAVRQGTQKVKDLETSAQRWIIDFSIWYTTT